MRARSAGNESEPVIESSLNVQTAKGYLIQSTDSGSTIELIRFVAAEARPATTHSTPPLQPARNDQPVTDRFK
jgi:hypothetical protein